MRAGRADEGRDGESGSNDQVEAAQTLAQVYDAHCGFVWRTARRLGIADEHVEDVMQEVFLIVHRRLADFDGRASMATWLFHLTRGVVSNWRRSRRREAARIATLDPTPAPSLDPEQAVEQARMVAFVQNFLDSLETDKRSMFEWVEIEGLPVATVAAMTGVKLNTAHSRLRLARREFQRALDRERAKRERRSK